jgi:hypothetical protein
MADDNNPAAPPAAGTAAWLLELISILEAILKALPVTGPRSEATSSNLAARVARLKAGFHKA